MPAPWDSLIPHTVWTVYPLKSLPALPSAWNTLLFAFAYISVTLLHDLVYYFQRKTLPELPGWGWLPVI